MRALALLFLIVLVPVLWRAFMASRARDPIIDGLIRPPVDRGFGEHDEAQEIAARHRRDRAQQLAVDAATARLPRRLVFLEDERSNVRGFSR